MLDLPWICCVSGHGIRYPRIEIVRIELMRTGSKSPTNRAKVKSSKTPEGVFQDVHWCSSLSLLCVLVWAGFHAVVARWCADGQSWTPWGSSGTRPRHLMQMMMLLLLIIRMTVTIENKTYKLLVANMTNHSRTARAKPSRTRNSHKSITDIANRSRTVRKHHEPSTNSVIVIQYAV